MSVLDMYKKNINYILSFFIAEIIFIYIVFTRTPDIIKKYLLLIIIANFLLIVYIPILNYFRIRYYLEKDYPFFIALMYSLSGISSSRKRFFEMLSEAKEFKYINKIFKRILDIAVNLRMGFAEATRNVQKTLPESNFKKFLDRFSSALEVGEDLTEYLEEEFTIALDTYEVSYKKSLENIKTLQDMAVAFMSSLGFSIIIAILIPFLVGIDIFQVLKYFVLMFILLNILMILLSRYMIIEDSLHHDLKEKPDEYRNVIILFVVLSILSSFLFFYLEKTQLPMLVKFSIALSPLSYASYRMLLFERKIRGKEEQFPVFITTLSGLIDVLGTSLVKVVDSLRIHDFKGLNYHIDRLYNRLIVSMDYAKSWYFFAAEIGSKLIARSILIFSRAVELGGDPKKIGEKISQLFLKVLDLRKIKSQFLSNSRGMFYGGYIAFVAIVYVSIEIVKMLQGLFEGLSTLVGSDVFATIGITIFNFNVDIQILKSIIDILVVLQAITISIVLKNIDGGSKIGIFMDLVILLWLASFISFGISKFFSKFFSLNILPGLGQ